MGTITKIAKGKNKESTRQINQGGQELVKYGCVVFAGEAKGTSASGGTVQFGTFPAN